MSFIERFNYYDDLLSEDQLNELIDLLNYNELTYVQSEVYHKNKGKEGVNKINKNKCLSYTAPCKNHKEVNIWLTKNIVNNIFESRGKHAGIVEEDLRILKYEEGNFFDKHRDINKNESKSLSYYTFLICLEACQKGGETMLYSNNGIKVSLPTGLKKGSFTYFHKDIQHQGKIIKQGSKIMLKGTIYIFNQYQPSSYAALEEEEEEEEEEFDGVFF